MERLVVFLDNEIYGGSERLMYTVLTSKLIRENYIVNALYGYNKPMHDGLVRDMVTDMIPYLLRRLYIVMSYTFEYTCHSFPSY